MAQKLKTQLGEGATCSVLVKFFCPPKEMWEMLQNVTVNQRVDDMVAVHHDIIIRRHHIHPVVYFISPTFPGLELHAACNKTSMLQEGNLGAFWVDLRDVPAPAPATPLGRESVVSGKQEFDGDVFIAQNNVEDIA